MIALVKSFRSFLMLVGKKKSQPTPEPLILSTTSWHASVPCLLCSSHTELQSPVHRYSPVSELWQVIFPFPRIPLSSFCLSVCSLHVIFSKWPFWILLYLTAFSLSFFYLYYMSLSSGSLICKCLIYLCEY